MKMSTDVHPVGAQCAISLPRRHVSSGAQAPSAWPPWAWSRSLRSMSPSAPTSEEMKTGIAYEVELPDDLGSGLTARRAR